MSSSLWVEIKVFSMIHKAFMIWLWHYLSSLQFLQPSHPGLLAIHSSDELPPGAFALSIAPAWNTFLTDICTASFFISFRFFPQKSPSQGDFSWLPYLKFHLHPIFHILPLLLYLFLLSIYSLTTHICMYVS